MNCMLCGAPMEPDGFVENPEDSEDNSDTRWICMFDCEGEDA
jgi:hypothetical protein